MGKFPIKSPKSKKKGVAKASELFKRLLVHDETSFPFPEDVPEIKYETKFDDPYYQAHRKQVKEYYPIYSDSPGAWQCDLMYMDYTKTNDETTSHTFLCLIHINSRYAFVRHLHFNKNFRKKDEDELWELGKHSAPGQSKKGGQKKNSKACRTAMNHILTKDIPNENEWLWKHGMPKDHKLQLNVIYTDDGSEFQGEFEKWCMDHNVRHVVFKPGEGKKTRLAIVERFNGTLRRYYEDYIDRKSVV